MYDKAKEYIYIPSFIHSIMIKKVILSFDLKEFKQLSNMKEEAKINGKAENWEDFILKLAKIR